MRSSAETANRDIRVRDGTIEGESLIVDLMDGRTDQLCRWLGIRAFSRRLAEQRRALAKSPAAATAIHWPEIDEDFSTEGCCAAALAPRAAIRFAFRVAPDRCRVSLRQRLAATPPMLVRAADGGDLMLAPARTNADAVGRFR